MSLRPVQKPPTKSLPQMQAEVVAVNTEKGWYDTKPTFLEAMALLHSEISEAVEAWRKHGTADSTYLTDETHLPLKPEGVGSEFADVLIRLLDDCHLFGIDLEAEYERKLAFNKTRSYRHGGKRL